MEMTAFHVDIVSTNQFYYLISLKYLDTNKCDSQPCQNGGTCSEYSNGYRCSCAALYTGTNCAKRKLKLSIKSWFN